MSKLEKWDPEDQGFWESTGKKIATRNLWVSIPNLLLGFSVWIYWGMVAKYIQKIHFGSGGDLFNFTFMNDGQFYDNNGYRALLFTLPAVAGLAGATLRIPNSFMIAICGGRNVKFMTTILLMLPALGAGIALQDHTTPFYVFILLAALSGVGGGAFSSSMSNISFFYPKKDQGLALGLNAGIGNLGVSVMQFLIPFAITFPIFGSLSGDGYTYGPEGSQTTMFIANAGLVWVPILAFFAILAFLMMHNMPFHKCGSTPVAVAKYLWLTILGYIGATVGIFLLIIPWGGFPVLIKTFLVVVVAVVVTLLAMRLLTPKETKENLKGQFSIFREKHNWVMTYLYVMTFGSFIGYANAFPKLIDDVFGVIAVGENVGQSTGLSSAGFIWIGAGVGALIRPLGGWLSDKVGGARVTHWDTIIMIGATIGAGYFVSLAMTSEDPKQYFIPFLLLFILLFATTGIGNGSTFRMIGVIFNRDQRGPVLGWTAAIAAYGAFLIPKIFATQIKAGTPQYALYGFAGYYLTCLVVNWWFYARKNAEIKC
ncbi:MAG: NarK/NasA family nitrate transporter [Planctomycetes bacterium]|nr:NarK/NasA family nitrate transporter [Planctomycetota bacterium]